MKGKQVVLGALVALALAAVAPAQGTVDVPLPVLPSGGTATVTYSDPSQAGQTVTIDIDNAGQKTSSVEITLDDKGYGSASWAVPEDWMMAFFTGPSGPSLMRMIDDVNP